MPDILGLAVRVARLKLRRFFARARLTDGRYFRKIFVATDPRMHNPRSRSRGNCMRILIYIMVICYRI